MKVSPSAYYDWLRRPEAPSDNDMKFRTQVRALFAARRDSAGSRTLAKKLREEGTLVSRLKVMKLMQETL